jgi:hypothetical protein
MSRSPRRSSRRLLAISFLGGLSMMGVNVATV